MWIEQSHIIWPFRLNITFGWLQKLNPGYEICIISYQVNLSSEVSAMFNSPMPSLNIRSCGILGGFPSRCQNLSSGAIRPGGLLSPILTLIVHLCKICSVTFPLIWHEASTGWWQWTVKRRIWLNHSKGHCQGQKGPVWFIFTYLCILISSIEMLPKCIASCSFSDVIIWCCSQILMLIDFKCFFKVRNVQFGPLLSI